MNTEAEINYKMVILARESRGLTQKELASKLGITQGKLSKIESGIQSATGEIFNSLTDVLNYPLNFFFQKEEIYNLNLFHYRKKISITKKDLSKSEALLNITRINVDKLLNSVEIPEGRYPSFNLENEGSPENCAEYLRDLWRIPKGRIDNLTKIIEDNGIIVIYTDFESSKIDGLSILTRNKQPIIFIDKFKSGDRQRLTLAHELGHIIMHLPFHIHPDRDVEEEAFKFAAALLMPEREIRPQLVRLKLPKLVELKLYWRVSMAAIIRRAKELSVITTDQYKYLSIQMSSLGYRTQEPADIEQETSSLLKEIIDAHLDDLGYSTAELANLFALTETEFNNKYLISKPKFRVIKSV